MNIANWLAQTARLHPRSPALLIGTHVDADYATFAARAAAIGAYLAREHGVAPGDRVALFMHNSTWYLECLYGIWWIGAAAVPINAKLHGREAAWICADAGAKAAIVGDDTLGLLEKARPDLPSGMRMLSVDGPQYARLRNGA